MSPQTPRGGKFEPEERRCNLMNEIKNLLARLSDQRGQTMAEYAVVLAVITVVTGILP
jgi:hypothetical protein